jgi:hypothetical protein
MQNRISIMEGKKEEKKMIFRMQKQTSMMKKKWVMFRIQNKLP